MKITAAVVSSDFSNVEDNVLFCRPECWQDLSHFIGVCQSDGVDIELPGNIVIGEPGYGRPEDVAFDLDAYEKDSNARITAYATRRYDSKKEKWIRKIHIACICVPETMWTRTIEY